MDSLRGCKKRIGEIQLAVAVVLFGLSFVFQRIVALGSGGPTGLPPMTYNAMRYLWSSVLLSLAFPFFKSVDSKGWSAVATDLGSGVSGGNGFFGVCVGEVGSPRYHAWYYGTLCGVATFFAASFQQMGLMHSTVAKTAFITSLYVITVPIFESFLPGGHMSLSTWTAAGVSIVGTYFVSGLAENTSEEDHSSQQVALISGVILFAGTLFWTLCIIFMDRGCRHSNCVLLTLIQFVVCTLLSLAAAAVWEPNHLTYPFTSITSNLDMIMWVGITETVAYVLCAMGQTSVQSSRAALLMSFESLAGALAGFLFLNEVLTVLEAFGCALVSFSFFISVEDWTSDDVVLLLAQWNMCGNNVLREQELSRFDIPAAAGKGKGNSNSKGEESSPLMGRNSVEDADADDGCR